MIFTDYWKVLVLNFSEMGNTIFFWAKKLMERWYLLGLFEFSYDIPGLGKYDLLCSVYSITEVMHSYQGKLQTISWKKTSWSWYNHNYCWQLTSWSSNRRWNYWEEYCKKKESSSSIKKRIRNVGKNKTKRTWIS